MKRIITVPGIMFLLLLSGCKMYDQLLYTTPTSISAKTIKEQDSHYVFENDTIKVLYSFYDQRGIMAFVVINKLNIPIYIDWKKSAFIRKAQKLDYYFDKVTTQSNTTGIMITGPLNCFNLFGSLMGSYTNATSLKEERITFIPPRSYITRGSYAILAQGVYFSLLDSVNFNLKGLTKKNAFLNNGGLKTIPVSEVAAGPESPVFVFSNFLTYSTKETFETESYVNNEFYIEKIQTMDDQYFSGRDIEGIWNDKKFRDPRKFYISNIRRDQLK